MASKDQAEELLDMGLPGYWYVAAKSGEVPVGQPVSVRMLGRDLVIWRGADGTLRCLDDVCPHRAAPLSRGEVIGSDISCRYHGVTMDGTGKVISVPGMAECSLQGKVAVRSYEVQEQADAVFVYIPSAARPKAPELTLPVELTSAEYTSFLCAAPWKTNYRFILDNLVDPMHGIFLHSNSFTLGAGMKQDTVKIDETPVGFIVKRVGQQSVNFDWSEVITEGPTMHGRVIIPYPPAAGPGGAMFVITFLTPVDETRSRIYFWRARHVPNEFDREAWRFMFRARLETRHWFVLEQDRDMLEHMKASGRAKETLYQHDAGVVRLRRILTQKARAEIAAMSSAGEAAE